MSVRVDQFHGLGGEMYGRNSWSGPSFRSNSIANMGFALRLRPRSYGTRAQDSDRALKSP